MRNSNELGPSREWTTQEWNAVVLEMINVIADMTHKHNLSIDDLFNMVVSALGSSTLNGRPNGMNRNFILMIFADTLIRKSLDFMMTNSDKSMEAFIAPNEGRMN